MRASQDKLSLGQFKFTDYQINISYGPPPKSNWRDLWDTLYKGQYNLKQKLWIDSYKSINKVSSPKEIKESKSWQPFQFWSQGDPPEQITEITSIWNEIFESIGISPIKLFDQNSALEYIKYYCPELEISFRTAFHYAVQSDVFRIAYAHKNDCIYLDSDLYPYVTTANHLKKMLSE